MCRSKCQASYMQISSEINKQITSWLTTEPKQGWLSLTLFLFIQALVVPTHSERITSFYVSKLLNFKIPAISHTIQFTPKKWSGVISLGELEGQGIRFNFSSLKTTLIEAQAGSTSKDHICFKYLTFLVIWIFYSFEMVGDIWCFRYLRGLQWGFGA